MREELYKKFGPLLLDAIVHIIKDEINLLRSQHGLSERTDEQIINAISDRLSTMTPYSWMNKV